MITFYDSRHPQIVAYLEVDVPVLPRLGTLMAEAGVALSDYWVFFGVKPLRTCHTPSLLGIKGGWRMELICKPKPRGLGGAYPPYSVAADYSILLSEKDFWKSQCLRLAGAAGPSYSPAPANWPSPCRLSFSSEYCYFSPQHCPVMPLHSTSRACPQCQDLCAGCPHSASPTRFPGFERWSWWPSGIPSDACSLIPTAQVLCAPNTGFASPPPVRVAVPHPSPAPHLAEGSASVDLWALCDPDDFSFPVWDGVTIHGGNTVSTDGTATAPSGSAAASEFAAAALLGGTAADDGAAATGDVATAVESVAADVVGPCGVSVVGSYDASAASGSPAVLGVMASTAVVDAAEDGAAVPTSVTPTEGGVGWSTPGAAAPTGGSLLLAGDVVVATAQGAAADISAAAHEAEAAGASGITLAGAGSAGVSVDSAAAEVLSAEVCSSFAPLGGVNAADGIAANPASASSAQGIGAALVNSVAAASGITAVGGAPADAAGRSVTVDGGVAIVTCDPASVEGEVDYSDFAASAVGVSGHSAYGASAPAGGISAGIGAEILVGAAPCSSSLSGVPAAMSDVPWSSLFSTAERLVGAAPRSVSRSDAPAARTDAPVAASSTMEPPSAAVDFPTVFNVNLNASWSDIMEAEFDPSTFDFLTLLPRRLSAWSSFSEEFCSSLSPRELRLPDVRPLSVGPAPSWWGSPRGPTILLTFCLKRVLAAAALGDCLQLFWYNTLTSAGVLHDDSWLEWASTLVPPPSPDTITAFARQWEWASRRSRADGKVLWASLDCVASFKARSLLPAHTRRKRRTRTAPMPISAMASGNGPRAPGLSVTFASGLLSPQEAMPAVASPRGSSASVSAGSSPLPSAVHGPVVSPHVIEDSPLIPPTTGGGGDPAPTPPALGSGLSMSSRGDHSPRSGTSLSEETTLSTAGDPASAPLETTCAQSLQPAAFSSPDSWECGNDQADEMSAIFDPDFSPAGAAPVPVDLHAVGSTTWRDRNSRRSRSRQARRIAGLDFSSAIDSFTPSPSSSPGSPFADAGSDVGTDAYEVAEFGSDADPEADEVVEFGSDAGAAAGVEAEAESDADAALEVGASAEAEADAVAVVTVAEATAAAAADAGSDTAIAANVAVVADIEAEAGADADSVRRNEVAAAAAAAGAVEADSAAADAGSDAAIAASVGVFVYTEAGAGTEEGVDSDSVAGFVVEVEASVDADAALVDDEDAGALGDAASDACSDANAEANAVPTAVAGSEACSEADAEVDAAGAADVAFISDVDAESEASANACAVADADAALAVEPAAGACMDAASAACSDADTEADAAAASVAGKDARLDVEALPAAAFVAEGDARAFHDATMEAAFAAALEAAARTEAGAGTEDGVDSDSGAGFVADVEASVDADAALVEDEDAGAPGGAASDACSDANAEANAVPSAVAGSEACSEADAEADAAGVADVAFISDVDAESEASANVCAVADADAALAVESAAGTCMDSASAACSEAVWSEKKKKTRFAKMANVFERSSSREFTGSGCTVSGLNSSLAFRSDPLGFN